MFRSDPVSNHGASWKLLPWYVNGTLDATEQECVERHLEDCDLCREEVTSLADLRQQLHETREASPDSSSAVSRGFQQALNRIDNGAVSRFRLAPPVRWALALQAAAVLVLASLLAWPTAPESPESFRTLSDPPAVTEPDAVAHDDFRVVFRETATEAEIRRLLRSVGAEIVAGPTAVGAYTLRSGRQADGAGALAQLREDSAVRLAEPVRPSPR